VAKWQRSHRLISYLVRSFTIKPGAAPDATILSRVCEVHTASVRAPAARPEIKPDGASSTTRPVVSRACSAALRFSSSSPSLYHTGRTVLWVYPDAFGTSKIWVRLWLATLDIVGRHVARGRHRYVRERECLRGEDVCGWMWCFNKGEWEVKDIGDVPEVTMVHPCAEGELPASICESSACTPGSAIGPPCMTASSKRTTAAFFHRLHKITKPRS